MWDGRQRQTCVRPATQIAPSVILANAGIHARDVAWRVGGWPRWGRGCALRVVVPSRNGNGSWLSRAKPGQDTHEQGNSSPLDPRVREDDVGVHCALILFGSRFGQEASTATAALRGLRHSGFGFPSGLGLSCFVFNLPLYLYSRPRQKSVVRSRGEVRRRRQVAILSGNRVCKPIGGV